MPRLPVRYGGIPPRRSSRRSGEVSGRVVRPRSAPFKRSRLAQPVTVFAFWGCTSDTPAAQADADPSKPKKQPNEWARFVKAHHAPTMKAYTLDFPTTIRALSMKWKDMGDAEKAVYQNEQSASKLELSPELLRRLP